MGFSKKGNAPQVEIVITHPCHVGVQFVFTFPKVMSQSAIEAEKNFLGLKDTERAEEHRKALIQVVAEMVTKEPEGFDDFPASVSMGPGTTGVSTSLAYRMRDYFDDPTQPELESIIVGAWRAYKAAALPSAYIKSGDDSRA